MEFFGNLAGFFTRLIGAAFALLMALIVYNAMKDGAYVPFYMKLFGLFCFILSIGVAFQLFVFYLAKKNFKFIQSLVMYQ